MNFRKERAARERNTARMLEANRRDETTLGEHLPEDVGDILPAPIQGPEDAFDPGEEFLEKLTELPFTQTVPPLLAPVQFATNPEALKANDELLQAHGNNIGSLLNDSQDATLGHGSNFRRIDRLEKVLGGHPEFEVLKDVIENGMSYQCSKEITKEERLKEVKGMIERGNHKSTEKDTGKAAELLANDVAQGFSIPVSPEVAEKIKGAMVQPLGLATQFALAEDRSRKIKHRLTQHLIFSLINEDMSVNSRIDMPAPRDVLQMVPQQDHPLHR
jgi:hypothetical protein